MTHTIAPARSTSSEAPFRWGVHALAGVAIGLVSPFTALAWPFAIGVGMVVGSSGARAARGERDGVAVTLSGTIVAAVGVLGMLIFGALVGGVVAIIVAALTAFSEKAAAHASPTDRGVARILLFVIPVAMWLVVFPLLGMEVDIRIGG